MSVPRWLRTVCWRNSGLHWSLDTRGPLPWLALALPGETTPTSH